MGCCGERGRASCSPPSEPLPGCLEAEESLEKVLKDRGVEGVRRVEERVTNPPLVCAAAQLGPKFRANLQTRRRQPRTARRGSLPSLAEPSLAAPGRDATALAIDRGSVERSSSIEGATNFKSKFAFLCLLFLLISPMPFINAINAIEAQKRLSASASGLLSIRLGVSPYC